MVILLFMSNDVFGVKLIYKEFYKLKKHLKKKTRKNVEVLRDDVNYYYLEIKRLNELYNNVELSLINAKGIKDKNKNSYFEKLKKIKDELTNFLIYIVEYDKKVIIKENMKKENMIQAKREEED
jgi:hypothetical protein